MKYKNTNHWTDKPNQNGLLFFAQILDESLFDYTLDSFKPKVLNTRLICNEILQTINNIKNGAIKTPCLKPLIEEFSWNLRHDIAIKVILEKYLDTYLDRIRKNENNLEELNTTILHIYHHLDEKKYLKKIQSLLIDLVPPNKEKEHIYYLTKIYITELINHGYNSGYIYYITNQFFFNNANPLNDTSPERFFNIFDFKIHFYSIIYKVKSIFKEFVEISESGNFIIKERISIPFLTGIEKEFIDNKLKDEVFVLFEKIETNDEITARIISEMPLSIISNLFSFYHHKEKPQISEKALVINLETKSNLLIEKPIKAIITKEDIEPKTAASKVKALFKTFKMPEKELHTLLKAIDIHSIALETDETENKLLNLWTAIEILIPKDPICGLDRITQIVNKLIPFQSFNYFEKIINQTASDLFFFNRRIALETLNNVKLKEDEPDRWYRICALMATKENDDVRNSIYAKLNDFPLLRWRIFWLNKQLANAKTMKKFINEHNQRVSWQIQRIYRVRNLIVHSGTIPSYTTRLVENLHNYFDNLVNYIIDTSTSETTIKSIKEGLISCEIRAKVSYNNIEQLGDTEITLDNYKLIF